MKNLVKLFSIILIAMLGCSLMARPEPDHRRDDRGHGPRRGNEGIRLATDIIDLVGVSLDLINPRPVYVQPIVHHSVVNPMPSRYHFVQPRTYAPYRHRAQPRYYHSRRDHFRPVVRPQPSPMRHHRR